MDQPSFEDIADTMTSSYRTMRYMENNMNQVLQTVHLLQACLAIITIAVVLLVIKKMVTSDGR